jgi:hypothetical protein
LASVSGIAAAISKAFRHQERRKGCAKTMVITISTKLDRMLLHSRATSILGPGMSKTVPS